MKRIVIVFFSLLIMACGSSDSDDSSDDWPDIAGGWNGTFSVMEIGGNCRATFIFTRQSSSEYTGTYSTDNCGFGTFELTMLDTNGNFEMELVGTLTAIDSTDSYYGAGYYDGTTIDYNIANSGSNLVYVSGELAAD
jgi:hypothetical protein